MVERALEAIAATGTSKALVEAVTNQGIVLNALQAHSATAMVALLCGKLVRNAVKERTLLNA